MVERMLNVSLVKDGQILILPQSLTAIFGRADHWKGRITKYVENEKNKRRRLLYSGCCNYVMSDYNEPDDHGEAECPCQKTRGYERCEAKVKMWEQEIFTKKRQSLI